MRIISILLVTSALMGCAHSGGKIAPRNEVDDILTVANLRLGDNDELREVVCGELKNLLTKSLSPPAGAILERQCGEPALAIMEVSCADPNNGAPVPVFACDDDGSQDAHSIGIACPPDLLDAASDICAVIGFGGPTVSNVTFIQ